LLVMSIASLSGHLHLATSFQWIGTYPALIAFSVATCTEVAGYYIPLVDHLLDTLATPSAVVAGVLISASTITGMSPLLKWSLAIIAGGGAAGLVQGATVLARGASTATTGGLGNPIVATLELVASVVASILALVAPLLLVGLLLVSFVVLANRWLRRKPKPAMSAIPVIPVPR